MDLQFLVMKALAKTPFVKFNLRVVIFGAGRDGNIMFLREDRGRRMRKDGHTFMYIKSDLGTPVDLGGFNSFDSRGVVWLLKTGPQQYKAIDKATIMSADGKTAKDMVMQASEDDLYSHALIAQVHNDAHYLPQMTSMMLFVAVVGLIVVALSLGLIPYLFELSGWGPDGTDIICSCIDGVAELPVVR